MPLPTEPLFQQTVQALERDDLETAHTLCIELLTRFPEHAATHHLLGLLARKNNRLADALTHFRQAVDLHPAFPEALYNLAHTHQNLGEYEQAAGLYRSAVQVYPGFSDAYNGLGNTLAAAGKYEESLPAYTRALQLRPQFPDAWANLGNALIALRQFSRARLAFQNGLKVNPHHYAGGIGLATSLHMLGLSTEAIAILRHLIATHPTIPDAYSNLANILTDHAGTPEPLEESVQLCQKAIELQPQFANAFNNLGNALKKLFRVAEAASAYQQALTCRPDHAETLSNLGNALLELGDITGAVATLRRAVQRAPHLTAAHGNLLYALHFVPDTTPDTLRQDQERFDVQHVRPLLPTAWAPLNTPTTNRPLRIGYVSPDFRTHCQSFFIIPLLANHDVSQVEVFCYADVRRPDSITDQIRGHANTWRSTVGLSDEQIAAQIREDRIDILVDLTMHMAAGRPLLFARRPAPVQLAWLAYPGAPCAPASVGAAAYDAYLTDPYLEPEALSAQQLAEQDSTIAPSALALPNSFWCYDPLAAEPSVNDLPALANGGRLTFACLNNPAKITPLTIDLWRGVLQAMPNSRLLLLCPEGPRRDDMTTALDIDPRRLEFLTRLPRDAYLAAHHRIDICLDTFPYTGHTTALDALWMGVPTLSLIGDPQHHLPASRAPLTFMTALELPQFLTHFNGTDNVTRYVQAAKNVTFDLHALQAIRSSLRIRLAQSPLMNGKQFARDLETAYRALWKRMLSANQ